MLKTIYFLVVVPTVFVASVWLRSKIKDCSVHIKGIWEGLAAAWLLILFWIVPSTLLKDEWSSDNVRTFCAAVGGYSLMVLIGYTIYYAWKAFHPDKEAENSCARRRMGA